MAKSRALSMVLLAVSVVIVGISIWGMSGMSIVPVKDGLPLSHENAPTEAHTTSQSGVEPPAASATRGAKEGATNNENVRANGNDNAMICQTLEQTASLLEGGLSMDVQSISVVGPIFDDESLFSLARSSKWLREITLDSTSVTPAGIKAIPALRVGLPKMEIEQSFGWATSTFKDCSLTPLGRMWNYDPSTVIRSVNYLRSQTHSGAIEFLRHYVENSSFDEQDCLLLIIPLAFESRDGAMKERYPNDSGIQYVRNPVISSIEDLLASHNDGATPFRNVIVQDDIPFLSFEYGSGLMLRGDSPKTRDYLIDWAAAHATLIKGRMKPGNPFAAAIAAAEKKNEAGITEDYQKMFAAQATSMTALRSEKIEWSDSLQAYVNGVR